MKTIILFTALIGVALARPQNPRDAAAYIVKFINNNLGFGGYSFSLETSDGTKRDEEAQIVNEGREDESIAVQGSYSYVGPDGQTYQVEYTADENGFQPAGDHIPPAASVKKKLGVPSAALASLAGGGLG